MHITSRRLFVGPLPKGWLSSHRKSWYKSWLGLKDYSSRAATFSADINTAHQRQLTGLLGPSTAAMYRQSFPQPTDLDEDAVDDESVSDEISPEPTAITPIDTAHEAPPQEQEDETSDRTSEPTPERPSLATITDSRTRTQRGSDPTLRPSSSSQVPETFYTAPESPRDATKLTRPRTSPIREESPETGDTSGRENLETPRNMSRSTADDLAPLSSATSPSAEAQSGVDFASETLLLPQGKLSGGTAPVRSSRRLQHEEPSRIEHEEQEGGHRGRRIISRATSGLVRFNLGDNLGDRQRRLQNKLSRTATDDETTVRRQRRASRCGEIVRAERMLVRIETTRQSLPDDFNENDSIKIDTKVMSKWREFLVVCRRGCEDNTPFVLQFYKTRVIPQIQTSDMKKNSSFEIRVLRNHTHVNLFSTLDKTLTLWHPYKLGTRIFVMRPRSSAHAVEWFTFLRGALGWKQPSTLFVHVPDLDISLRLQNPFAHLGETRNENDDVCTAVLRTMKEEQAIAAGIIKTCLTTLSECTEWNKIVAMWGKTTAVGLAWRRYDRLEWVQGPNEQRMYGTIAMRTTHELELRPKQHYPTVAKVESRGCKEEEPLPAEGFLILLTSQRGRQRRFGKNFFRRLYVYTQDQYLCFCRPAKAIPPAPPKIATISGRCVPSSSEIQRDTPIIYEVNPFPVKDGEITWLSVGRKEYAKSRDAEAFAENRRVTANAANSEGYINLCRVSEVRAVTSRDTLPEQNANMGDVEYHGERAQPANGAKPESKDDRSFEIVLDSGLVVRFRAYNVLTRQEWVGRLTKLSEYWKARTKEDMATLKYIRRRNLKRLEINEEQESMLGQFAEKWEVSRAEASPELFHACGMSGCRAIKVCITPARSWNRDSAKSQ